MSVLLDIEISLLSLLDKNPRKITKDQMDKLCCSLQSDPQFLKCRPVLVNRKDGKLHVYAGNQRVRAAKKIGWKVIPCLIDDNLSEEVMKERIIKDNKTYGEFDFDILANEYEIETLLMSGFIVDDLVGLDKDVDIIPEKEEKKKKEKNCPNCGHQLG